MQVQVASTERTKIILTKKKIQRIIQFNYTLQRKDRMN